MDRNRSGESRFVIDPEDAVEVFGDELADDVLQSLMASHPLYAHMENVILGTIRKIPR